MGWIKAATFDLISFGAMSAMSDKFDRDGGLIQQMNRRKEYKRCRRLAEGLLKAGTINHAQYSVLIYECEKWYDK